MPHESRPESGLKNLKDFYLPTSDEVELAQSEDVAMPEGHQQRRFTKDLGPAGEASFMRGDVQEGDEAGKSYETWTLPGEMSVEVGEVGSIPLTKVRAGWNRESNAKGNDESMWGDGEFAELPSTIDPENPPAGWEIFRNETPDGEHVWGRYTPTESTPINLELPRLGLTPGGERPLDSVSYTVERVDADLDDDEMRAKLGTAGKPRGRVKFKVERAPAE